MTLNITITDATGMRWSTTLPADAGAGPSVEPALTALTKAVAHAQSILETCQEVMAAYEAEPNGADVHAQWYGAMMLLRESHQLMATAVDGVAAAVGRPKRS